MRKRRSRTKPPVQTLHLRDLILAGAAARGVALEQHALRIEVGLPVLHVRLGEKIFRGCTVRLPGSLGTSAPDVVTVHGSGYRASKMWPRKGDGTFDIQAIVDHLLALIEAELSRSVPNLVIPTGVSAAASGLHVVHLAAVRLWILPVDSTAEHIVDGLVDEATRARAEAHLVGAGLTGRDMRELGDAAGLYVSTPTKMDFDPFEPINDRIFTILEIGWTKGGAIERRYVLILDRDEDNVDLADPAGEGRIAIGTKDLAKAWELGARLGRSWMGTVSAAR